MKPALAAALCFVLVCALAFTAAPAGRADSPGSGGLSISILLPVNGSTLHGVHTVSGNASGPQGEALTVQVSLDGGPWQAINGSAEHWGWRWETYNFADGPHNITARVTGGGFEATATASYILRNDLPPIEIRAISPPEHNFTVYRGDSVKFSVTASDPEGRPLSYGWWVSPKRPPAKYDGASITVTFNSTGTFVVTELIKNGENNSTVTWNVTVEEPPSLGWLDVAPCAAYLVLGLVLGAWYGRRPGTGYRGPGTG